MRLRKPCEHGRYEAHWFYLFGQRLRCPGGEFVEAAESLNLFGESEPYGPGEKPRITPRDGDPKQMQARQAGVVRGAMAERTYHKDGGAPPLDWWLIADEVCICGFRHVREGGG